MSAPDDHCTDDAGCITCGDVALPSRVVSVDHAEALAVCVDEGGAEAQVDVTLVEPLAVGDTVLVHAGTALTRLEAA